MFPPLDGLVHAPARLQLVALLEGAGVGEELTFPELQHLTGTTAGNLSTHLRRLEDSGYIAVTKGYDERTPVTRVSLTREGRERFETYRRAMTRHLDGSSAIESLQEVRQ